MTNSIIRPPYDTILGLNAQGLSGRLYVGVAGQDPKTNPIAVYWDAGGTTPASQPIDLRGGYIVRAGTPAQIYAATDSTCSMLAETLAGQIVWFASSQAITSGSGGDLGSSTNPTESLIIACSDEATPLTIGTAKRTFRMPYAFTLEEVRASLKTSQSSGSLVTIDINEAGTSLLSTKLSLDNNEKTSVTANTPPVIADTAIANDAEITIDLDQVGDGTAVGLTVYMIGRRP